MADINVQKYFSVTFATAIKNNPVPAGKPKTKYQLVVTGPSGGSWVIDTTLREPTAVAGSAEDAETTMTVSLEDMQGVLSAPNVLQAFTQAFFSGKLKVEGDYNKVLPFGILLLLK